MRRRRERDAAIVSRLEQLDRRLEDLEDTVAAALRTDRLDDLADRVEDLAMTSTTHDDLLGVRLHAARLAGEVTLLVTELRADHSRMHDHLADHLAAALVHLHPARVDAVSQTVEIETELASTTGVVLPGMSGQVRAPSAL